MRSVEARIRSEIGRAVEAVLDRHVQEPRILSAATTSPDCARLAWC